MRFRSFICVGALLGLSIGIAAVRASTEKTAGELAFEQLKTLVGEWEGKNENGPVKVTYTLVAGGTALMERLQPAKESEMITMYSMDGSRIQASHYCSYGNQPQMRTETLKGKGSTYSFSLVSVTGLKSPDEGHMTGLVLTLVDRDHMKQEWKNTSNGKNGSAIVEFIRKREKAATIVPSGH